MGVGHVVRVVADETNAVTENAFEWRSRKAGYGGKDRPERRRGRVDAPLIRVAVDWFRQTPTLGSPLTRKPSGRSV